MTRLPLSSLKVRNLIGHKHADCGFWNGLCDDRLGPMHWRRNDRPNPIRVRQLGGTKCLQGITMYHARAYARVWRVSPIPSYKWSGDAWDGGLVVKLSGPLDFERRER